MIAQMPCWPAAMELERACGCGLETFKKVCPVKPLRFTDSARGKRYLCQRLDERPPATVLERRLGSDTIQSSVRA